MTGSIISLFLPDYPVVLVYMLQASEYQALYFLKWFWRTSDFRRVMHRRQLDLTKPARGLLAILRLGILLQLSLAFFVIFEWLGGRLSSGLWLGLALIIFYPVIWAHLIVLPMWLARVFIIGPKERLMVKRAERFFAKFNGTIIAVAGSYGKTTMKEILAVVLGEGKKIAVTPGNMNVPVSHARWARNLSGDEDILIIEYGEGKPGDVARFSKITHPKIGIITGVAPAHLDKYPTAESAAEDIFSLASYLNNQNIYVNNESTAAKTYIKPEHHAYSRQGVDGWRATDIKTDFEGVSFKLQKAEQKLELKSALLGEHQVGPLALAATLAERLGLTPTQIKEGIAKTVPFEHRLQPTSVAGALVIDDTYNGNIEGIKAGLELLKALPAKRKLYITPGLVDQGVETEAVHHQIGELIAKANPEEVVLMQNSVTKHIKRGLRTGHYKGVIQVEEDPLGFYTNLDQFVAAGDLVLMQNDWPDQYN